MNKKKSYSSLNFKKASLKAPKLLPIFFLVIHLILPPGIIVSEILFMNSFRSNYISDLVPKTADTNRHINMTTL